MKNKYLANRFVYFIVLISFILLINLLMIEISFGTEIKVFYATPKDNPMGLAWDGEYLWLAHDQGSDKGIIVKLNPYNGNILDSFPSPGTQPKGLTFGDGYLWIVDIQNNNYNIFKIDPTENGKVIDYYSLDSGGLLNIEKPIGLAYGGNHLWVLDDAEEKIYNIDLIEKTIFSINSPTTYPGDLAWDGNNLYVAGGGYDRKIIYKVNPLNSEVIEQIDIPGEDSCVYGLTWDGNHLWMVDDCNEIIYQLDIDSLTNLRSAKFNVINTYTTSKTSPSIELEDIELMDISNGTYYIEGSALDTDGIKYILINGKLIAGSDEFGAVVTNVYGDFISVEAGDNSGNITQQKILINKSNISPTPESDDSSGGIITGAIISAIGVIIAAIIGVYLTYRR